jgi:predicted transcriptional regulator of viral defense system
MKMVINELVEQVSTKHVIATSELVAQVTEILGSEQENGYVYKKFIYPLLKKKYLTRIRRNLYHVTPPGYRDSIVDRFTVASQIKQSYYIGFHAALEFYGVAYSYRNRVHVGVKPRNRFDEFSYQNTTYVPFLTNDVETGVLHQSHRGNDVRVCSKERLFIECVKYPDHVGGWEEVLKSLQGLGGIDFDTLLDYLFLAENQSLLRRVGLVLEMLKGESLYYKHLEDSTVEEIRKRVEGNERYLEKGKIGALNKKWKLYISDDFEQYLRGV